MRCDQDTLVSPKWVFARQRLGCQYVENGPRKPPLVKVPEKRAFVQKLTSSEVHNPGLGR
jgi:hypothetical protein